MKVAYEYWGNDTSNNYVSTGLQFIITSGESYELDWSAISASPLHAGDNCTFEVTYTSMLGLSHWVFNCTVTGSWQAETAVAFTESNEERVTFEKTLPKIVGLVIQYQFKANDTNNNWVETSIATFTTTYPVGTIPSDILFYSATYDTYINFNPSHTVTDMSSSNGFWYFDGYGVSVQNGNLTITDYFQTEAIDYTVTGNVGTTSWSSVYCANLGKPYEVLGAKTWDYDSSLKVVTAQVDHASSQAVSMRWGAASGGGLEDVPLGTPPPVFDWLHMFNFLILPIAAVGAVYLLFLRRH